ncbi:MAG TPA: DNA polymerase I, partial [Clostridiales bacterium]|nr:DNA polymerase I [Clostridiales bacterium]
TVENIYDNLDKINATKAVIAKLEAGRESAKESKWLATIMLDVPIETDIELYKPQPVNVDETQMLLSELEMFKLLERLKLDAVEVSQPVVEQEIPEVTVLEMSEDKLVEILKLSEPVYYLYEKDCLKVILGNEIYVTNDKNYALDFLQSYVKKVTFGAKADYRFCFENNTELKNIIFDAEIAGYLLNASSSEYSIKMLCGEYSVDYYADLGENSDIVSLKKLCETLELEIKSTGMESLLNDIELPLTEVLASMEYHGIKVDVEGVRAFGDTLTSDLKSIQTKIYEFAGHEFNISSPKQLGEILFNELGLPAKKKTKSGYSTNAEVLEGLRSHHPIIELILQYRQLFKLNSTYVEGLLKTVAEDGRIHTNFKQTETRTGRISSTEPNMQNIPVRTELGRNMRRFFVADDGKELIDADYSQIELRILAHLCDDEHMKDAFLSGLDIHTSTASQVFKMPVEMVTSSMRSYAKAVNFGIIYGIGAFSLSKDIGVSVAEADKYIKDYLHHYKNVEKFTNDTVEQAKENGYVTTLFGRRRYVAELSSTNKMVQGAGKRIAMNTPIQGTAADIIKIAMVKVYRRLKEENLNARLILQVHDELIVEGDEKSAKRVGEMLSEEMMNACELSVSLIADVNTGKSWYDAKG